MLLHYAHITNHVYHHQHVFFFYTMTCVKKLICELYVINVFIMSLITFISNIVTYDNVEPIKEMYNNFRQKEFGITYTLKNQGKNSGSEVMVFSHSLKEMI